ncbi:MAG: ABC transporter permease [Actinomycetota bacterium]|nr:ABC transporter permease [Actinomycetota bacterium]
MSQLTAIRSIPGVEVAAPIAIVGYQNFPASVVFDLSAQAGPASLSALRISPTITADAGMSHFAPPPVYLIGSRQGTIEVTKDRLVTSQGSVSCNEGLLKLEPDEGSYRLCVAPKYTCPGVNVTICGFPQPPGVPVGDPWIAVTFPEPLILAGVDPAAEAQLDGLNRCISSGQYFRGSGELAAGAPNLGGVSQYAPLLVSDRSFIQEQVKLQIARTADASGLLRGVPPQDLPGWTSTPAVSFTADQAYRSTLQTGSWQNAFDNPNLWVGRDVRYDRTSAAGLTARSLQADLSIYGNSIVGAEVPPAILAPPEATDVWFRPVSTLAFANTGASPFPAWKQIGTYNPDCLPGFSPLSGGRMEAYAPPVVRLADGRTLGPTRSMGGYVNAPPVMLTSLVGARLMDDPKRFSGAPGDRFISAIRIRVAGTAAPGKVAEARLARVAAAIHDRTALQVDIVKGSSPRSVAVALAAGKFGRPALKVSEAWSVKGVAFRFARAVRGQNLALFSLILLGAIILVGQTAYTAVRARRREFGMLRAMGWPAGRVGWLVEIETLLLGFLVGLVALLVGFGLARGLHVGIATWQWLAAAPVALVIAGLAAIVPAAAASRGPTVTAMRGGGRSRQSRVPRSVLLLGVRDLLGAWRTEAVLGIAAVAIGAGLLGAVVLVELGFRGQLDTTVLGAYLSAQVQPFHAVLALLALVIGALAAAEIVMLSYLERQPGLAALRALGWSRLAVIQLLLGQALAFGVVGGLLGGLFVLIGGAIVGTNPSTILVAGLSAMAAALVATCVAVAVPLAFAYRLSPADSLRDE